MAKMEFNADERQILRWATAITELSETKLWKEGFIPILDDMIRTRELIVQTPLHDLPQEYGGLDLVARVAIIEHVKGALIGLRLARDLPLTLSNHARAIRNEHSPQNGDDGDG